jgi:hypothetical protein
MASTNNKNYAGNYQLEQFQFQKHTDYDFYLGKVVNTKTCLPGNGLLPGRISSMALSKNYTNIESELFGIGSTNLVTPKEKVVPIIINTPTLDIFDSHKILLPTPLIVEKYQRPFFLP